MDSELIIRNNSENNSQEWATHFDKRHSRVILVSNKNELFHIYLNPTTESKISAWSFHV